MKSKRQQDSLVSINHRIFLIIAALIIYCVCSTIRQGYAQPVYFNKVLDLGVSWGAAHSVVSDDTSYSLAAITGPGKKVAFIRLDSLGNIIFIKKYGKSGQYWYPGGYGAMKNCFSEGYILGGAIDDGDSVKGLALRINSLGDTLWTYTYSNPNEYYLSILSAYTSYDKGFIFSGEIPPQGNAYNNLLLIKTDSLGGEDWRISYGNNWNENGWSIIQTADSGYVVGGYTYLPGLEDSGQPLIVKFDKDGNYLWNKKPGGPLDDDKAMICASVDSNIIALTVYADSPYGGGESGRINIIKLNQQGIIIWNKKYGPSRPGRSVGNIKLLSDGGFICCGNSIDSTGYYRFSWIMRFNEFGDSLWLREYAYFKYGNGRNILYDITPTSNKGFIACGQAYADPPNNLQKIWVLKVDSVGCDTAGCDPTVGIAEEEIRGQGDKGSFIELWPNPCSTVLSISLKSRQSVVGSQQSARRLDSWQFDKLVVEIYDIFGRKVGDNATPLSLRGGAGGGVPLDVSTLPPGLYLLVVKDGRGVVGSSKFVIAR